jgi:signal peptidase
MSGGVSGIKSFEDFMSLTALTVFPAVIANLVYNYLSVRYGALPNIAYRLITTLYLYIIPFRPNMPDAILAFVNLITPIIIYVFIDTLYEKRRRYALKKKSTLGMLLSVISVIIAALFVMLVSCQFKYGAIVIATESMTGEINKGDAIIYESYDRGNLEVGEVIVFEKDGVKVVHRIVSREKVAGEMRYYTKGDANNANDPGFIKGSDIRGRVLYKVPYIGYPTIYLRELLSDAFD